MEPPHVGSYGFERSSREIVNHGSFAWLPSQNGAFFVCLQPHHATVLAPVISVFNGAKPVPLCEPSQNGWPLDRPHAHQK